MKILFLSFLILSSLALISQSTLKVRNILVEMRCDNITCFTEKAGDFGFELVSKVKAPVGIQHSYAHTIKYAPTTDEQALTVDSLKFAETNHSVHVEYSTGNLMKFIPMLVEIDSLGFYEIAQADIEGTHIRQFQSSLYPDVSLYLKAFVVEEKENSWEVAEFVVERIIE